MCRESLEVGRSRYVEFLRARWSIVWLRFKSFDIIFLFLNVAIGDRRLFISKELIFFRIMWSLILGVAALVSLGQACLPTVTTVSGTHAPSQFCSGELIFNDDFDHFDLERWQHENTLGGGGVSTFTCVNCRIINRLRFIWIITYTIASSQNNVTWDIRFFIESF